ncbi:hypothetical protein K0M31_012514 [Melipona bicolor]|uniref:Uncharacterized protein n=1 Tax=Melipona bicolor TaxID=60889 RepID=A0AA40FK12_9HYME|nr:hypothetical protein K0M31_012514 [Melipona bicolor]
MSSQFPFSDTGDIDGDVGPFITVANRSPVSRREAVLQVFRQHRNTSEKRISQAARKQKNDVNGHSGSRSWLTNRWASPRTLPCAYSKRD